MKFGVLRIDDLRRQAAALGTSMERLLSERGTMPSSVAKLRYKHLSQRAKKLGNSIELCIAWDTAITLAYRERTGLVLMSGEPFTHADAKRAEEILKLYPTGVDSHA